MVTISPLTCDDQADWLRLWQHYLTFYRTELDDDTTAHTFARLIDPASEVNGVIARDGHGAPVGLVHWLTHASTWAIGDSCYLEDLFVDPNVRGGGIGRSLIAHVTDWAHTHGASKVYWLTEETNSPARILYDRVATNTGFVHYEIEL
jgi:GNAT superfamily N-acetyltransferase